MGLKLTNSAGDRPVLWLYGDIGEFYGGITANMMREAIASVPDDMDMDLRVHCEGGEFHEGVAMHTLLAKRRGKVNGMVDGIAASAGTFPLMACSAIEMASGSWLMIHDVRSEMVGSFTVEELRTAVERMEATNEQIRGLYKARWKGTPKELATALAAETYLDAKQAIERGLADKVSKETARMAARLNADKFGYKHTPDLLLAAKGDVLSRESAIMSEFFPEIEKEQETCA